MSEKEMEINKNAKKRPHSETLTDKSTKAKARTSTSGGDDDKKWLSTIKKGMKDKVGEEWEKEDWTDFCVDVARRLRPRHLDEDVVETLVGLFKLDVVNQFFLKSLANNKKIFIKCLKEEGIGLGISAFLLDQYSDAC